MRSRPLITFVLAAILAVAAVSLLRQELPEAFRHWRDVFETLSFIIVFFGVPVGLHQYFRAVKKEQLDREYGTYNALDEKFIEFQNLCLAHPRLDIFDVPDTTPAKLTAEEEKEELIAFTMLFSIFERAFLMYNDQSTEIKQKQWTGWDEYIQSFCKRDNFRRAWRASGATFDQEFEKYIVAFLK